MRTRTGLEQRRSLGEAMSEVEASMPVVDAVELLAPAEVSSPEGVSVGGSEKQPETMSNPASEAEQRRIDAM